MFTDKLIATISKSLPYLQITVIAHLTYVPRSLISNLRFGEDKLALTNGHPCVRFIKLFFIFILHTHFA